MDESGPGKGEIRSVVGVLDLLLADDTVKLSRKAGGFNNCSVSQYLMY